jgi:hypothetical protein
MVSMVVIAATRFWPRCSLSPLILLREEAAGRAQMMASFVKLLLDQAEQQAKLRESNKKDEAAN